MAICEPDVADEFRLTTVSRLMVEFIQHPVKYVAAR